MTNGYSAISLKESFIQKNIDPYLSDGFNSRPDFVRFCVNLEISKRKKHAD